MKPIEIKEESIKLSIKQSRIEPVVSLKYIADIIVEEFSKDELEAFIKELLKKKGGE